MATSRPVPLADLKLYAKVHYPAKDGKVRHGVILRVWRQGEAVPEYLRKYLPKPSASGDLLLVVACTSSRPLDHHEDKTVFVPNGSRGSKALRLNCDSWFKGKMVEVIPTSAVESVSGSAPPGIGQDLERLLPCVPEEPEPELANDV